MNLKRKRNINSNYFISLGRNGFFAHHGILCILIVISLSFLSYSAVPTHEYKLAYSATNTNFLTDQITGTYILNSNIPAVTCTAAFTNVIASDPFCTKSYFGIFLPPTEDTNTYMSSILLYSSTNVPAGTWFTINTRMYLDAGSVTKIGGSYLTMNFYWGTGSEARIGFNIKYLSPLRIKVIHQYSFKQGVGALNNYFGSTQNDILNYTSLYNSWVDFSLFFDYREGTQLYLRFQKYVYSFGRMDQFAEYLTNNAPTDTLASLASSELVFNTSQMFGSTIQYIAIYNDQVAYTEIESRYSFLNNQPSIPPEFSDTPASASCSSDYCTNPYLETCYQCCNYPGTAIGLTTSCPAATSKLYEYKFGNSKTNDNYRNNDITLSISRYKLFLANCTQYYYNTSHETTTCIRSIFGVYLPAKTRYDKMLGFDLHKSSFQGVALKTYTILARIFYTDPPTSLTSKEDQDGRLLLYWWFDNPEFYLEWGWKIFVINGQIKMVPSFNITNVPSTTLDDKKTFDSQGLSLTVGAWVDVSFTFEILTTTTASLSWTYHNYQTTATTVTGAVSISILSATLDLNLLSVVTIFFFNSYVQCTLQYLAVTGDASIWSDININYPFTFTGNFVPPEFCASPLTCYTTGCCASIGGTCSACCQPPNTAPPGCRRILPSMLLEENIQYGNLRGSNYYYEP